MNKSGSHKDSEIYPRKPAPTPGPGYLTFASRYSLQVFLILSTIFLIIVDLVSIFFWIYLTQEDTIKTSKERAVKFGRNIVSDLNSLSQNIARSFDAATQSDASSPKNTVQKFIDIAANFEGKEEVHLLLLDSQNVIKQVSRIKDRKWIGERFDRGSNIVFFDTKPNLSVSELLTSLDQKTPFFEWRQKDKSNTFILQIALTEFWQWCRQISFIDRQNVFLSLSSTGKTYLRFDCSPQRNLDELWKKYQIAISKDPSNSSFRFQGHDYMASHHQPDILPINITIFTKIPNAKSLLSENYRIIYPLTVCPLLLLMLVFLFFRLRINEHVHKIRWITSNLQKNIVPSIDQLQHSPEFQPAFSSLRTMHDTLGQLHTKNSIKTKLSTELGLFFHPNALISKATELLGIQSRSESSFFLPFNSMGEKNPLKGWSWTRHSLKEIPYSDQDETRIAIDGHQTFKIPVTIGAEPRGDFYLVHPNLPEKTLIEIATTLVSIIESNFELNKTHKQEALKELENLTLISLQSTYSSQWQIDNAKYELASLYLRPSRNSGEFVHFISSPNSEDFLFVVGGPLGSSPINALDQIKIPPISWTINGIMDGYRRTFEKSGGSSQIKTSEIILAIQKVIHDLSGNQDNSWSFFVCCYDASLSSLSFSSINKRDPLFLRRTGLPINQLIGNFEGSSRDDGSSQDSSNQSLMDQHIELMNGDILLLMVGNASTCQNERHQIFHEILFRRLIKADQAISPRQIRDTIKSFQEYYYQDMPLDKDLCFLVFQRLDDEPGQSCLNNSSSIAS